MFDLDRQITAWREKLVEAGLSDPERLAELQSHLQDDIERQIESGAEAQVAFEKAAESIGQAHALRTEFAKIRNAKRSLLSLLGIPHHAITSMNTPQMTAVLERRWLTYLKTATWLFPCLSLWAISTVFIFPKLKELCRDADVAPPIMRTGMALSDLYIDWGILVMGAVVVMLVLLEWRSSRWPRYRRAFLGFTVFILNSAVLVLIWVMLVSALLAAPALMHRGRATAPTQAAPGQK
jgi:hypothetical protein